MHLHLFNFLYGVQDLRPRCSTRRRAGFSSATLYIIHIKPRLERPETWLRWVAMCFSRRRHGLNSRSVHVIYVEDKVVLRQAFLSILLFCPVFVIPPMLYTHLRHIRLLPEGQMGEHWETSRKLCSFENRGTLNIKLLLPGRYGARLHSSLFNLSNLGGILRKLREDTWDIFTGLRCTRRIIFGN